MKHIYIYIYIFSENYIFILCSQTSINVWSQLTELFVFYIAAILRFVEKEKLRID